MAATAPPRPSPSDPTASTADDAAPTPNSFRKRKGIPQTFDFRRPSTLSREHVRTMQIVQETLARGFSTTLASMLRAVVHISLQNIEQQPYDEYIRDVPNPTVLSMLSLRPVAGTSILQIPLSIGYTITELMLGGAGGANQPQRAMSELELALMRGVVEQTLPEWHYAFEPVAEIEPAVVGQESNPQFAQVAAPTDMMVVVSFDVKIEATHGTMTLCMPYGGLQPHLEERSAAARAGDENSAKLDQLRQTLTATINDASITASATFRQARAPSSQIMNLEVGDVLLLNHPTGMPLTLETDGVPIYDATIGRVNRQLGLQIVGSIPPERRRRPTQLHVLRRGRRTPPDA